MSVFQNQLETIILECRIKARLKIGIRGQVLIGSCHGCLPQTDDLIMVRRRLRRSAWCDISFMGTERVGMDIYEGI